MTAPTREELVERLRKVIATPARKPLGTGTMVRLLNDTLAYLEATPTDAALGNRIERVRAAYRIDAIDKSPGSLGYDVLAICDAAARASADTARLDWLEANHVEVAQWVDGTDPEYACEVNWVDDGYNVESGQTLRAATDAARAKGEG